MHIWERRLLHCVPVSLKSFDAVKLKLIMLLLNCILMKPTFEYLSSSIFKTKQVPGQNSWILMPSSAESLRNRYNRAIIDPHGEKRHREYTEEVYDFNILHLVFFFLAVLCFLCLLTKHFLTVFLWFLVRHFVKFKEAGALHIYNIVTNFIHYQICDGDLSNFLLLMVWNALFRINFLLMCWTWWQLIDGLNLKKHVVELAKRLYFCG